VIDDPSIRTTMIVLLPVLGFITVWGLNAQFTRDARLSSLWKTARKAGELFRRGDPA
jgi:hypothetical protein